MTTKQNRLAFRPAFADRLSRLANGINSSAKLFLILLVIWVAFIAAVKSHYRRLWLDEVMGTLIAKLPHASDIFAIVKTGADNQPPFYHFITRASIHLLRNDASGLRFPSLIGYLVFCLSLYLFVSRRTSKLYGLLAFIFPSVTGCWYFASEGRPYALVLGCTGLAAVCWQSVVISSRLKPLMLAGLFLSLGCAINLHYYSPLLLIPFAFAESVRSYRDRRVDWGVWLAISLPILALLPYMKIIGKSRLNSGIPFAYYANPTWYGSALEFAGQFLGPALVAFVLIGCLYCGWRTLIPSLNRLPDECAEWHRGDFTPELTLIILFTLLPLPGIALSKFVTHVFFTRYIVGSMFGVCALFVVIAWLAFEGRKEPALLAGLVLCAIFARTTRFDWRESLAEARTPSDAAFRYKIPQAVSTGNLPIVAAGVNEFMDIRYYGNQRLLSRTVYVGSEALANQYLGFTFLERMMFGAAPYFGTHVAEYRDFVTQHPNFYMLGGTQWWLVPKLLSDGARLQMLQGGTTGSRGETSEFLFFVEMPAAKTALPAKLRNK